MKRSQVVGIGVLAALLLLAVTSCAAGPSRVPTANPAGFWLGLWHGLILPITFIVSLFNDAVGVYDIHNNGHWYDFGFLIGVSATFSGGAGSSSAAARRSRRTG
ncbi:hypothetical protein GCM10009841_23360 [Microlunatus panaciterrae]|uniref:Uncharacterized protein n=1 Tax=Microlunatus panaciterrae TaxID=400768 RepID=A0ABS2RFB3_9ACTN|nr:hypothetical protein [Microlunatus panaciterrae]MBM7797217.1 hypothetical protein [Microlunatus panaciterrae]